jgi:hypothetical protein
MKIRPVGAELLRPDRRTDMTKLIFAFFNLVNAPKNPTNALESLNVISLHVNYRHVLVASNLLHVQFYLIVFYNYLYDKLFNSEFNLNYLII